MRMIGHLQNEAAAHLFSDHLLVKGIKNQIEADHDGSWAVWIHAEDEIERARGLLRNYLANPNDPSVSRSAEQARDLRAREEQEEKAAQKRQFGRDQLFPERGLLSVGRLTLALMAISVIVFVVREYTTAWRLTQYLLISEYAFLKDLPEVRQGQVWRLITPIFLHMSFLHILFNMLWLSDLGGMIERKLGTFQLLAMVLVIGVTSNLAQYFVSGPGFGGMSGVVYGLLGYVWIRGKFDPGSGFFLHPTIVMMMLIWLVLGYTQLLPLKIANTVHTVGLIGGVVWGLIASRPR